eukprot:SAG31_NODE_3729_length_3943_cov_6.130593_1_plen_144_part_00
MVDTFSISALHLSIKVPYFSNSGHKNEKVTPYLPSLASLACFCTNSLSASPFGRSSQRTLPDGRPWPAAASSNEITSRAMAALAMAERIASGWRRGCKECRKRAGAEAGGLRWLCVMDALLGLLASPQGRLPRSPSRLRYRVY